MLVSSSDNLCFKMQILLQRKTVEVGKEKEKLFRDRN